MPEGFRPPQELKLTDTISGRALGFDLVSGNSCMSNWRGMFQPWICTGFLSKTLDVISLHHDRCDYDAVLQEQFMGLVAEDSTFKYRNRFVSLTSESWQDCLMLQPADLIAYENFKESMRSHTNRNRRGSLAAIIDLDAVSGRSKGFTQQGIREMKSIIHGLGEDAKRILFAAARIK